MGEVRWTEEAERWLPEIHAFIAATPPSEPEAVFNFPITFDFSYTLRGPTLGGFLPMSVVARGILVLEEIQVLPREGPFPLRPLARARAR